MRYITPSILFALATLMCVCYFILRYLIAQNNCRLSVPTEENSKLHFAGICHPMEKKDRLPILIITAVYALTAFFQLGDMTAPQTTVDFAQIGPVTLQITGSPIYTTGIRYYSGLGTGSYNIEISEDGEHWSTLWRRHDDPNDKKKVTSYYFANADGYTPDYALGQGYNQLFKWIDITVENPQNIQYLRIRGKADKQTLQLAKLCLLGQDGQAVPFSFRMTEGSAAPDGLDEMLEVNTLVPTKSTWRNSTYFDEIYHARTAKEHVDGIYPYEVTHPPLGKLIIGLGIRLFGMTPFVWRFSGTLLGVLMLPILYIFLKNLFGKTIVSICGTTLFATEFMHLTQTRISTIDTYAVFFILGMYFFMYRYLTLPAGTPFYKGVAPLFLSGLFWGLGAASKWTVFYAGIGLAVLYFMGLYQKLRDWPTEGRHPINKGRWVTQTILFSVLCFILIPFAIYVASYLPYAEALGVEAFAQSDKNGFALLLQNLWGKLTGGEDFVAQNIPRDNLLNIMANNQWYMLTYHQGVHQAHPYSSWWFQWVVDARPILYYMDNTVTGFTTRFAAFANPVVCWTGFFAVVICGCHAFSKLWAKWAFLGGLGCFAALVVYRVQQTENGIFDPALQRGEFTRNLVLLLIFLALYLLLAFFLSWAAPVYYTHMTLPTTSRV